MVVLDCFCNEESECGLWKRWAARGLPLEQPWPFARGVGGLPAALHSCSCSWITNGFTKKINQTTCRPLTLPATKLNGRYSLFEKKLHYQYALMLYRKSHFTHCISNWVTIPSLLTFHVPHYPHPSIS